MRKALPSILILAILTLCPLVPSWAETGRAPNQEGNTYVGVTGSSFSASPTHIGDQNVSLSVTVRNLRQSDGNASNGDERLYNVTVEVLGVEDSQGQRLQPPASPVVWDVIRAPNERTLGYIGEMSNSYAFTGMTFDVKGLGVRAGFYNVSVMVHYVVMTSWNILETEWSGPLSEELDNIRFEVASNVVVGAPVALTDSFVAEPLYAGSGFQLIGVPVRTLSGTLKQVSARLNVPDESPFKPVLSPGTAAEATVDRITGTSTLYFRIEVPSALPGAYDASNANITLSLQYVRERNWNSAIENIAVGEEGHPLTFTVDYTPLLEVTGASPTTVVRGTLSLRLSVALRNDGNADLVRLRLLLEADADFFPADFHYDGSGGAVPGPAVAELASLKRGENATVVFDLSVRPNAAAGIHRLDLGYSGYYFNDGRTGNSSGYYPTDGSLYGRLRGGLPSVDLEVTETPSALELLDLPVSSSPLNPDGEAEGLTLSLSVRNDEHFAFFGAHFTLVSGEGTALRNPSDRAAGSLAQLSFQSFGPDMTVQLRFEASLNTSLAPGLHQLTLVFTGTDADSGAAVLLERNFTVRIGPFGPRLVVASDSAAMLGSRTLNVPVAVSVHNAGGQALSGLEVRLAAGPGTPLLDPASPSATFITRQLGSLAAGSLAVLTFAADLDPAAAARSYSLGVELRGAYAGTGEQFESFGSVSFRLFNSSALLVVQNVTLSPSEITPGKPFSLGLTIKNVGGERAGGIWVGLQGLTGGAAEAANASTAGGWSGLPGEVPFSADIALRYIGELGPGQETVLRFSMVSDATAGRGRTYQQPVRLWYQDQAGADQEHVFSLAVKTKAAPPEAAPAYDWVPTVLLAVLIIVVIMALAVLLMPRGAPAPPAPAQQAPDKPARPLAKEEAFVEDTPSEVASAVPLQQLPPPPPGFTAPSSQSQPETPLPPPSQPAAKAARIEGGQAGGTSRPGPLEGYTLPGAEDDQPLYSLHSQKPKNYTGKDVPMRICPTCSNEVKLRFVKCPYCGSELPPVA